MSKLAQFREFKGTQKKPDYAKQVEALKKQEQVQGLQKRKEQEQAVLNAPLVSKLPATPIAQKPILSPVLPTLKAKSEQEQGLKTLATQKKAELNQITPQEQIELEARNLQAKQETEELTDWEKKKLTLPGNVFYKNLSDAFTFGLTGVFDSEAYNKAFEETEKENKVQAVVGNITGSLGGQGILYKAVNKALAGTKLAGVLGGLKGFGASQGTQLVADAIVQTPIEVIRAIEEDKTLDEAGKDWLVNRGLDAIINLGMGTIENLPKLKQFISTPRGQKALAEKGVDANALTQAIDSGDVKAVQDIIYVNQFGVASKEPFEQLQLPAPKKMDDFRNWRSDATGINLRQQPIYKITDDIVGAQRGQTDAVKTYTENGTIKGSIEYADTPDEIYIKFIDVREKRKGIGTKLIEDLYKTNPNKKINWGELTEEGAKLKNSIVDKVENPEYSKAINRISEIDAEIKRLEELPDSQVTDAIGDRWNALYDEKSLIEKDLFGIDRFKETFKGKSKIQRPPEFTVRQPQYPPLAKDFTTERPFTVTPSEVSKVEQFKQFKAQNPAEQINVPETDDKLLKKFRLDLFGSSKEKPVDAIIDGVEVRVTELFDDQTGKKIARLSDGREVDYNSIKPSKKYKPFISDDIEKVIDEATKLKDIGTTERYTTDVYRNFEKVFGKGSSTYKSIKKALLDPFDKAKGNMADDVIKLTDDLKKTIVDGYGIKPKSKESKLVMRFGEGRIDYDGLLNQVGKEKADKIVRANQWFREKYDNLLDEINVNRINMNKPVIEKRQDYYRHYNEIANTFENIKNILDQGRAIDPRLSGLSEYTKPREAWASFKQRRTDGTKFTEDAVGGFLDYIKAGTYAKHIDPMISEFRTFRNQLANETTESRNLNKFIEYLDDYANDLSGKTNPFDRWLQKAIGREKLAVVNAINSRVKANAVLGNLSSSLSQIANVPQGIAVIKNPIDLSQGIKNFTESIVGGGDAKLYKQSSFLKERFLSDAYSQFNMRLIDKPKQAAVWTLGALDEVGTKFIWSSAHAKAVREGIENPIKYADDLTRKLIAGRGIGEIPLLQKSNVTQLVAPFTLEVNNLWKVMKDMAKEKDIAGLSLLFIGNYILNKGMEATRGSDVVFDPINAIVEGYDKDATFGDNLVSVGGSLAGETLSNLPLGSSIASAYPEYGARIGELELPSRAELFGESDPTRYGVSLPVVKAIQDPLKNLVLPWGGAQVSKTIQGAKTMGLLPQNLITEKDKITKETLPASVTKTGKIRTVVEPTPLKTAQALAFGGYASPEVRNFFESKQTPFGENQTPNIYKLTQEGFDINKLTKTLSETRNVTKKEDRRMILEKAGYLKSEISRIMQVYFGYKE